VDAVTNIQGSQYINATMLKKCWKKIQKETILAVTPFYRIPLVAIISLKRIQIEQQFGP
jgi:hypothetical protein